MSAVLWSSLPHPYKIKIGFCNAPKMRWAGHVALWWKGEECTGCWWGNPRGRDRWGDPGVDNNNNNNNNNIYLLQLGCNPVAVVDGRIILGWTFRRWD